MRLLQDMSKQRNTFALVLVQASLLWVLSTTGAIAEKAKPVPWPAEAAAKGFSLAQAEQVIAGYAPMKLALMGNQALYSYLNMPAFFPHHVVAREGSIRPLKVNLRPRLGGMRRTAGELSLDQILTNEGSRVQGLIVLHKGQVVYERYPGMRATDSHLWWSMAKLQAGLLTEMLIHEGLIDPQKPIVDYLTEFADSAWRQARIEDVLNMASGMDALDSNEGYTNPESGIGRLIFAEGILSAPDHTPTGHNQALKMIESLGESGRLYQYSSANTNMLGLLIEQVTKKRYADVLQEKIWSKIGAEGDGLMGLSPDGRAIAHGMFSSRLRDLARFGLLFVPTESGSNIVPASVLARINNVQRNQHYRNAPKAADWVEQRLGIRPVNALAQWDALFADGDMYKSGYGGQALYVSPSRQVVIALFATSDEKSIQSYFRDIAHQFPVNLQRGG